MSVMRTIKWLAGAAGAERELDEPAAANLAGAMLDGGVGDLELGALLTLLERRPIALAELHGYGAALGARTSRMRPPAGQVRPVLLPCYRGVREHPHLLPLVALILRRIGVPVLAHGALDGGGGVAAAAVFRELGVMPCMSVEQAGARLEEHHLAFVPPAVLSPGLAALLAMQGRLGFGEFARSLAKLLQPFEGEALQVIGTDVMTGGTLLCDYFAAGGRRALVLDGVEGEAFADPRLRPRLAYVDERGQRVLFEPETAVNRHGGSAPAGIDAHAVAAWIRSAMSGEVPVPLPLVNQAACCLYGAGYADDINQAKAIVAIESGSLAAA
jgi:anthranilate phosphoribosyltransferase